MKFANVIAKTVGRRVDRAHMAAPRNRSDDAHFAPLDRLDLPEATTLVLGRARHIDCVEGARRRMIAAERRRCDFAIATECGFGRRDPATMFELFDIHAEVADG